MKIKFCGAAKQVTGSMHLVELESGYKVLVDCGLDYEQQKNFHRDADVLFLFDPKSIDCVILTHSHVDHSGNIPTLIKAGFGGKIICTPPTAELTGFLLLDSLKIMEQETKAKNQKGRRGRRPQKSLYNYKDLQEAIERFVTVHFYEPFRINNELEITFREAGHILGAASVLFEIEEKGKNIKIGFTGDLGNYNSKLMKDPLPFENIDYLITESTYGGRFHKAIRTPEDEMLHYINATCVQQPGRLVVPAFSVGRTQAIIFALNQLSSRGLLPPVKIFVDSPLAIRTTHVYGRFKDYLNDETRDFMSHNEHLFDFDNLHYINDKKESEMIENHYEPCVIISAAGMVEGGRIQEHVRNNVRNAYCTILIAGFCAEGTLGHKLLQGQGHISINGVEFPVFASVAATDAFSAHPDHAGLKTYINASGGKKLKKIFLVHGEESAMTDLRESFIQDGMDNVVIPEKGEVWEIM